MRRNRDENDQGGTAKRGRSGKIFINFVLRTKSLL